MNSINKTAGAIIIVFGITGDLSQRKLLPALYHLFSQDVLPKDTTIIGISRRPLKVADVLNTVELCVLESDKVCDPVGLKLIEQALQTLQLQPDRPEDYADLKQLLHKLDPQNNRQRLVYMSVPASAARSIIKNLGASELNSPSTRLLLEKPFGHDLKSAESLIKLLKKNFEESQIYRIDHYLAKETAQNLLAFRLHNPIFTALWNADHIQSVHIRAWESIGIEGRAGFYEQTGALRDLIQSHLMQLLSITLMELPIDMTSQSIHISKQQFLEQLLSAKPSEALRGQYQDYKQEVSNPKSSVETYALVRLEHGSERWRGTEIVLETGKALKKKATDIVIEFKTARERRHNSLTFQIQPNEGIGLDLVVKEPGFDNRMRHAALEFRYKTTFENSQRVDAYERVLMDAIRSDQSLFASDREVLATWRILQPVLESWKGSKDGLVIYEAGSAGPSPK